MDNLIVEAFFSGLGLYLLLKNKESYKESSNIKENFKKKIFIYKFDTKLQDIPDGTPIYISGPIKSKPIVDPQLNLTFNNAVCIKRKVSLFQVQQKQVNIDNKSQEKQSNTHSNVTKEDLKCLWNEVDQQEKNNPEFLLTSDTLYTDKIYLGPFEFEKKFTRVTFTEHTYPKFHLDKIMCDIILNPSNVESNGNGKIKSKPMLSEYLSKKNKKLEEGGLIFFSNPKQDTLGDMKISYYIDDSDKATVIGAKYDNTIVPIHENGENFFYSKNHICSVDDAFSSMESTGFSTYVLKNVAIICGVMLGYAIVGSLIISKNDQKNK
jgi:hypothetical protein